MKKELFYSLEASTRTNHPSPAFQAHKRPRSLAEIRGARQPVPFAAEAPNKTRAPIGRKETPRKEAAVAAHTNSTGTYKGDARAPAVNARRQRRRPPAARSAPQKRRPRLHRRRRVPILRFARPARERRRGQQWPWPVAGQPRSAGAACTQCRCWRPPSAGLPYFADHRDDARTRRRKALEGFSTSVPKSSTTPLYIHRRRPPRRYRTETEISCHVCLK